MEEIVSKMVVDGGKRPKNGEMLKNHQTFYLKRHVFVWKHFRWILKCFEITEEKRFIRLFMLGTALVLLFLLFSVTSKDSFVGVAFIIQPHRCKKGCLLDGYSRLISN